MQPQDVAGGRECKPDRPTADGPAPVRFPHGGAMHWIGLRGGVEGNGLYLPGGLGRRDAARAVDPAEVLAQGTLMLDFVHEPADRPRNILRHAHRDPHPAGLTLRLDPDGTVRLLQRQDALVADFACATRALAPSEPLAVSFIWDAPAGTGLLSVGLPDSDGFFHTVLDRPLPLTQRDVARILGADGGARVSGGLRFAALADTMLPAGPMPGLGPHTPVQVPGGEVPVHALRPGATVLTGDGTPARVVWAGAMSLPARGRFAPVLLRAPHYGLTQDILVTAQQRLRLTGSEVEYLFAQEQVAVAARHLADGRAGIMVADQQVVTWYQVLLDRPGAVQSAGLAVEQLALGPLLADPATQAHSLLAGLTAQDLARAADTGCAALRDFEALTLCRMRAA